MKRSASPGKSQTTNICKVAWTSGATAVRFISNEDDAQPRGVAEHDTVVEALLTESSKNHGSRSPRSWMR